MARKLTYGEILDKYTKLDDRKNEMPFEVWACFWESKPEVSMAHGLVCFNGDYKTKEEIIKALDWLKEQFQ